MPKQDTDTRCEAQPKTDLEQAIDEVIAGLERRTAECVRLARAAERQGDRIRLTAKAATYQHAANLVAAARGWS